MPELPEVETVRRQLEPELVGRRIERVEVLDERWTRPDPPAKVEKALAGRSARAVERRGKYLIVPLDDGRALVMHLRMTGNLLLRSPGADGTADLMDPERFGGQRLYEASDTTTRPPALHAGRSKAAPTHLRHVRARIELDDGSELLFTDPRRFGTGAVMTADELERYLAGRVGIEPLTEELTPESLATLAAGRRAPLKSFLLGQAGIAGIGNIYADEALFRARLHPLSPAGSMKAEHCEDLCEGIVAALEAGLAGGGASIDDYRDLRGEQGRMQDEFLVHRREDEACMRCGTEIRRIVLGGRSTYFCPGCQRRLRRRARRRRSGAVASGR